MADFYPYIASTLPMLRFEMKPPFSYEEFLQRCAGFIPVQDILVLRGLDSFKIDSAPTPLIKKWLIFDSLLRNELVKVRASRKKLDPERYLRPDGYAEPAFTHLALAAQRNPSPLEAEKMLDQSRWDFLESLGFGHYFDLDFLIIYAYKLFILQRWERIDLADGQALLKEAVLTA